MDSSSILKSMGRNTVSRNVGRRAALSAALALAVVAACARPQRGGPRATEDDEEKKMKMSVLLLGLKGIVVDDARAHLQMPDVELYGGTGLDDVRSTFARTKIDHVIMGGGLELEVRLAIVREVFRLSDATTVHMKDVASGPQGFLPFVRSVLRGLRDG